MKIKIPFFYDDLINNDFVNKAARELSERLAETINKINDIPSPVVGLSKSDKARDKRLKRLYGISLAEYNVMLKKQDGGCAICGSPPGTRSLHVDHSHKFKYLKVKTIKTSNGWVGYISELGLSGSASKKNEAIRITREMAKAASVRGIICFGCNGGLRKFRDNSAFLANASEYLRKHHKKTHVN